MPHVGMARVALDDVAVCPIRQTVGPTHLRERPMNKKVPKTILLLKTINADNTNSNGNGFKYGKVGSTVVATDWNPKPVCGGGIHGLLNGCGNGSLLNWADDAVWVVL